MALLDLQTMDIDTEENCGHEAPASSLSLLLCDSLASISLCL